MFSFPEQPWDNFKPDTFFPRVMSATLFRKPSLFYFLNKSALPFLTTSSLSGLMTARFLLNLREWDRMTNRETDQLNTHGTGGDHCTSIRFNKSEPHATQWSVNSIFADDPLLKPVPTEMDIPSSSV